MKYKILLASLLPFAVFGMKIEPSIKTVYKNFKRTAEQTIWINALDEAIGKNDAKTIEVLLAKPEAKSLICCFREDVFILFEKDRKIHPSTTALMNYYLTEHDLYSNETIIELFLNAATEVNVALPALWTPLHIACDKNIESSLIELLIKKGAFVNAQELISRNSPLHYAQSAETINILIDAGADLELKNKQGNTPLLRNAYSYKHDLNYPDPKICYENMITLISHGADVHAVNNDKQDLKEFIHVALLPDLLAKAAIEKTNRYKAHTMIKLHNDWFKFAQSTHFVQNSKININNTQFKINPSTAFARCPAMNLLIQN